MFIIFGSPRSGTTLLASSLALNPRILIPGETDFIIPMAFILDRIDRESLGKTILKQLIPNTQRFIATLGKHLTAEEVGAAIDSSEYSTASILDNIFRKVAEKTGRDVVGDKSPNDLRFVRILIKTGLFKSGLHVVHVVRDPRCVAESLIRMQWPGADDPIEFCRTWNDSNLMLRNHLRESTRYFCLRYEDLVNDFEQRLRDLCSFLGTAFSSRMLVHHERGGEYDTNGVAHQHLKEPVSARFVTSWKRLSQQSERQIRSIAGEGMLAFGYA